MGSSLDGTCGLLDHPHQGLGVPKMSEEPVNETQQDVDHGRGCWTIVLITIILLFALLTAFLVLTGG